MSTMQVEVFEAFRSIDIPEDKACATTKPAFPNKITGQASYSSASYGRVSQGIFLPHLYKQSGSRNFALGRCTGQADHCAIAAVPVPNIRHASDHSRPGFPRRASGFKYASVAVRACGAGCPPRQG